MWETSKREQCFLEKNSTFDLRSCCCMSLSAWCEDGWQICPSQNTGLAIDTWDKFTVNGQILILDLCIKVLRIKYFTMNIVPPPCKVDHLPPLVHVEVIERGVEGAAVPDGGDVGGDVGVGVAHLVIGFGIIPANFQHNHYFVSPQLREGDQS